MKHTAEDTALTLLDRVRHFEEHQRAQGDEYGAEVLYQAARSIEDMARFIQQHANKHPGEMDDILEIAQRALSKVEGE